MKKHYYSKTILTIGFLLLIFIVIFAGYLFITNNKSPKEELHLIILWNSARNFEEKIINDVGKKLKILECIDVAWTPEYVTNNYIRLYGFSSEFVEFKKQECGTKNFLIITAIDENPKYDFGKTW